jgi:hypothetical protein
MILLKNNTWRYVNLISNKIPITNELNHVVQGMMKALSGIGMYLNENNYPIIQLCINPRDAWKDVDVFQVALVGLDHSK